MPKSLAKNDAAGYGDPVIVSSGVDWLTVTTPEPVSSAQLAMHIGGIVAHQRSMGGLTRGWGMSGFSGYRVGEIEFGTRGDEMMVRVMSGTAQRSWRRIYELAGSVTRLDLQVTVDMGHDCQQLVWDYYRRANIKSLEKKRGPRNRVILGNDGGATLYCGDRTSTRFGRCYAKGPQTKLEAFKTCLRFEVQYNGKLAKVVSSKLYKAKVEPAFALERSVQFFQERIGRLPIRTGAVIKDTCSRTRSNVRRKLDWFREGVKPSVQNLIELGYRLEVLRALGLAQDEEGPGREYGPLGPNHT